jgi:hypothetical protein
MEKSFYILVIFLSSHLHVLIIFLNVLPMKISFLMLVFYLSKSLGFQGPKLKLNVFLTLLVSWKPCNVVVYKWKI